MMTSSVFPGREDRPPTLTSTKLGPWEISAQQCHILRTTCRCTAATIKCNHCTYSESLELPDLPEMTFDRNWLVLRHAVSGKEIKLNTLDALKMVDAKNDRVKVSYASEWLETRQDSEHINNTVKPFDWTFTTGYTGSISEGVKVRETDEQPDKQKLLRRDQILYHTEVVLFEDELADNGSSKLVVKCRVMPSFLLILLRQYLRVDKVMYRIQETRIYAEREWDYAIREVTVREAGYGEVESLGNVMLFDEWAIGQHLPVTKCVRERLDFG